MDVQFADFPIDALPLNVTVCVDELCNTTLIDPLETSGQTSVPIGGNLVLEEMREGEVTVEAQVLSAATGEVMIDTTGLGRVRRSQPNGKGCDPVCYQTLLTYDAASGTLTER